MTWSGDGLSAVASGRELATKNRQTAAGGWLQGGENGGGKLAEAQEETGNRAGHRSWRCVNQRQSASLNARNARNACACCTAPKVGAKVDCAPLRDAGSIFAAQDLGQIGQLIGLVEEREFLAQLLVGRQRRERIA